MVLPIHATKESRPDVVKGPGFKEWLRQVQHDLVLSSRAESTWKAYRAWVEVFEAWLGVYEVSKSPAEQNWEDWVEVLSATVTVLAMHYSVGTLQVFTSAVSAYMQDSGMCSPHSCRFFSMLNSGITVWLGLGKHKKPPIEAWHVAEILKSKRTNRFTGLQLTQAKALLGVGW